LEVDPLVTPPPRPPDEDRKDEGTVVSDFLVATQRVVIPPNAKSYVVPIMPREILANQLESRNELTVDEKEMGLLPRSFSILKRRAKDRLMKALLLGQPGEVERPDPASYADKRCTITIKQRGLEETDLFQKEFEGTDTLAKGNELATA
jgi:hypothetical protein